MSASLVGSEMCIRDRSCLTLGATFTRQLSSTRGPLARFGYDCSDLRQVCPSRTVAPSGSGELLRLSVQKERLVRMPRHVRR
eukprot:9415955-Alexandrium_andersonii.AAC.1